MCCAVQKPSPLRLAPLPPLLLACPCTNKAPPFPLFLQFLVLQTVEMDGARMQRPL